MKIKAIAVILLISFSSCSHQESIQNDQLVEVNYTSDQKVPVIFDTIMSKMSILKLETPEGIFLGSVDKLIFSKNRIYISDVKAMNSVFIFDHFGIYINHIEGGYKGPGEFIRPQSITTDFDSDELYVFDDKLQKIISYNSEGQFISEQKFKYTANDITKVGKKTFAFNAGYPQIDNKTNSFDLLFVSEKGKVDEKYLPLRKWRIGSIFNKDNTFTEYMDTIWYCPVYNDTIYQLTETGPIPTFHINMGKKFIDDALAKRINIDDPSSEYQHAIHAFHKAGSILYFGYTIRDPESGRNVIKHVFFDTSSKNSKSGQYLSGISISCGLFTSPIASTGDYFVAVEDAIQVKQSLEFTLSSGKELPKEKMELLVNLSEYDNPCLLFYKVAPF